MIPGTVWIQRKYVVDVHDTFQRDRGIARLGNPWASKHIHKMDETARHKFL